MEHHEVLMGSGLCPPLFSPMLSASAQDRFRTGSRGGVMNDEDRVDQLKAQRRLTNDSFPPASHVINRDADLFSNEMRADYRFSQAILDTLSSHVALLDEKGFIIAVNKAWTAFAATEGKSGLARTDVGANYLDLARSASGPCSVEGLAAYSGIKAVLDGLLPKFSLEYSCHSPLQQRWFLLTVVPIADTPIKAMVTHFDTTSRRDTEKRLLESEEQLRELALHIHLALWVIDPKKNKVLYISPGYEKIWGRSCQSLIDNPQSYMEGIHPLDQEMMIRENAAMYETGHVDVECRVQRPDGSVPWVWIRGYAVRDEHGQAVRFVGVIEDITERKASQDDQARLAAIVECSDDAIVSYHPEGIVITWNHGAERLYGYLAEEMIGRNIRLLYTADDFTEYLRIKEIVKGGERIPAHDTKRLRKDGTLIAQSVSISPILVKNGEIVGASKIAHDITRVRQLESQFRQVQKMEAVGTLAGGVAHDFNNLLTIISGYSELMLLNMPPADPKREALKAIHSAGERAASLTRQLLAFSRKTVLEPKILDLNNVVKETESMLRRLIGEDILLSFLPDPRIHRIKVDPGLLGQVLMNLAVNSRDAMPQGGNLSIETCNSELDQAYCQDHAGAKPGKYVQLSMTDTGCGMTPEIKARVFEPFFTTKAMGQGTGLGLPVVYGIIKQSDGYIEVNSEPGVGTCFKIYFQSVDQEADNRIADPFASIVRHGTETVLVVEDEDGVRGIALLALQMHGYTVLTARDGKDALRILGKHVGNIDMLITDVVMPGMSGRELAEKLGPRFPHMKTLFLSGYTNDAVIRNGLIQEQIAFLQKPFSPLALARKVRAVLDETK